MYWNLFRPALVRSNCAAEQVWLSMGGFVGRPEPPVRGPSEVWLCDPTLTQHSSTIVCQNCLGWKLEIFFVQKTYERRYWTEAWDEEWGQDLAYWEATGETWVGPWSTTFIVFERV